MEERPPSFVTKWGELGEGDGEFTLPMGLAVDSSDNVYIADMNMDRIQKFDSDGTLAPSGVAREKKMGSSMSLREWL